MTKDSKNDIPNITMRMQSDFSKVDTVMCAMSKILSITKEHLTTCFHAYPQLKKKIAKSIISFSVLTNPEEPRIFLLFA